MNASAFAPATPRYSSARTVASLLSVLLLSAFSARAEAPPPSQEFWEYLLEFGNAQGEVFDPSDYVAVSSLPAKANDEAAKWQAEHVQQSSTRRKSATATEQEVSQ